MVRRNKQRASRAGRLRIVAGNWRSRLLDIADVEGLRPTAERVRETLFNWLAPRITGARCLDLFAGTGALGLEALSRGAASVVFVEKSAVAARQLEKNIDILVGALEGPPTAETIRADALDYLRSAPGAPFDIVFLDPPYAADLLEETCRLLAGTRLLADDARVYLELDRKEAEPELPGGWQTEKNKTAGKVRYMLVQANRSD
ncbi:MAG: 16S rRNA (guanine(966)-N(2))-methyltransferase RsmD [Gammaproteobacteria bacterium]|nr:16S rRNA (guanine(966)-N(2))-methyltransferase RsmD [Gammaproteobacteria bacterium]NNF50471.1 16S rRNA (guanine(966)-N(2))-methyltransferase RsmD [Woeseiaceae bacterium]